RARTTAAGAVILVVFASAGCSLFRRGPGTAAAPEAPPPLPVEKAPEDVIVAAWAEPARLPPFGGQAQILVRLQKEGGAPFPGVQVRLQTSEGTLYSGGRVLVTDKAGQTRDRLTTRRSAAITLNAGGTVYRFRVAVSSGPPS
ncbi:MAG TPA: hypothetical protein VMR21_03955, partial [Vicinamibacteria bacterium]|nr:hypothetical protein [Vicinamibacteria bacterium]